jgi:AmmeMemoRadiSam system protein A
MMSPSHPLVQLARRTVEEYVRQGRIPDPPSQLPPDMRQPAAAFVTLYHRGQLRGCIGTLHPTRETVAEEVIQNAISAASRDPRFEPVQAEELEDLEVKVDVLGEPERVASEEDLDPKRYGLIVQSKRDPLRRGVLLPDLPGIDTVEKQVYWTRVHKAHISDPDEPVEMHRFEVVRYQ